MNSTEEDRWHIMYQTLLEHGARTGEYNVPLSQQCRVSNGNGQVKIGQVIKFMFLLVFFTATYSFSLFFLVVLVVEHTAIGV